MNIVLLAIVSILLSVGAQFALKAGMRTTPALLEALRQPMVLFGLSLYAFGAVCWLAVLGRWDVSKAYPMVGLGFVLSALVGTWLGESVGAVRWVGILMICGGVVLVGRS
jgi:drug/metabolite transporter (DMT)-like permease